MAIKFAINTDKAMEALAYLGMKRPNLTPKYISKIFFYAEKWHLNRYGRPIVADTYIAMPQGPVPSTIKDLIDEKWNWIDKPENFDETLKISSIAGLKRLSSKREANYSRLSESDIECLDEAIEYCCSKSSDELSNLTHLESAWINADANQPMDYIDFIDEGPHKEEILDMVFEMSRCGVL